VDVPELSCCVLLRLCGSYVLFAQAVGRIMRAHPSKRDAVLIDHSGAVYEHGFPDEDVEWALDEGDSVDRRVAAAKKKGERKQPITCPACATVYAAAMSCPACGHKLPRRLLPAVTQKELLVEARRGMSPERLHAERASYWRTCLYVMAARGQTCGAAAGMFRSRFGAWPDGLDDVPYGGDWKRPVSVLYPHYARRLVRAQ
jgi:DNA repair protein RadD